LAKYLGEGTSRKEAEEMLCKSGHRDISYMYKLVVDTL
jgi:hypothetical protein